MPRKMFGVFIAVIVGFLAVFAWSVGVFFRFAPAPASPAGSGAHPPAASEVTVYYGNSNLNPGSADCSAVFPVTRETREPIKGYAALDELLKGPTWAEQNAGYYTSINGGVKLNSLTIIDKTAYADFDAQIEKEVGGSCRVTAIRSQITQTLMQFPTVRSVIVSVDGRASDALQP